jgi:opacity protein-like surface antigen
MTKKLLTVGTILMLIALVALAADAVTGKWTMEQPGRNGGAPRVSTLDLKADGAKLTGTVTAPAMGGGDPVATPITNGKVDGNNISFDVVRDMGGMSMTIKYEGTVTGGDMKIKVTRTGQDGTPMTTDATAKKATT